MDSCRGPQICEILGKNKYIKGAELLKILLFLVKFLLLLKKIQCLLDAHTIEA